MAAIGMNFIDNTLYIWNDTFLIEYDEAGTTDWDGSSNNTILVEVETNPMNFDQEEMKITNHKFIMTNSAPILNSIIVDGVASAVTVAAGTAVLTERRPPRDFGRRGKTFAFKFVINEGTFILYDLVLEVKNVIRRRMTRN